MGSDGKVGVHSCSFHLTESWGVGSGARDLERLWGPTLPDVKETSSSWAPLRGCYTQSRYCRLSPVSSLGEHPHCLEGPGVPPCVRAQIRFL